MVTINEVNRLNSTLGLYALSTDELPTDGVQVGNVNYKLTNGSTAFIMDSGIIKIFDAQNKTWLEL